MKIAITFRDDLEQGSLWFGSGIAQNIKFYYDMFELMGHEVVMLVNQNIPLEFKEKKYNTLTRQETVDKNIPLDIIIEAGTTISQHDQALFRSECGAKIVGLRCGNQYTFLVEGLFLKNHLEDNMIINGQDAMWLLPHHSKQVSMVSALHSCPAAVVPYIWEPSFIEKSFENADIVKKPNIYVMEANINYVKNALIPMLILDKLYKVAPNSFNKAVILNSNNFYDKQYFVHNFVSTLESLQSQHNKVFFDVRRPIHTVFDEPHILLGHQVDNDLNNLYKEALYMGIPLVHNAPSYKSCGFYYPDLDVDKGVEQVLNAIESYKPKEAASKNKKLLHSFSIHNPKIQEQYNVLLQNALDGK